jgi:hypothetical protein
MKPEAAAAPVIHERQMVIGVHQGGDGSGPRHGRRHRLWMIGGCRILLSAAEAAAAPAAIASRIAGAELGGYDGGHLFFVQDPAALPEFEAFLQAPSS